MSAQSKGSRNRLTRHFFVTDWCDRCCCCCAAFAFHQKEKCKCWLDPRSSPSSSLWDRASTLGIMLQRSNYPNVTQKEVTFSAFGTLMLDLLLLDCAYRLSYFHLLVFFLLPPFSHRKSTLNLASWYICYTFRLLSPADNSPNVLSLGTSSKFHLALQPSPDFAFSWTPCEKS